MTTSATTTTVLLTVMLMAATLVIGREPAAPSPNSSMFCGANLMLCADALKGGTPSTECCTNLDKAVKTQLKCLCDFLTNPQILARFNLTVENALLIPKSCGISAESTMCSAAKSPLPQGVPPVSAPPPKDDKGDATKVAGTGLVWIALMTIFY